MKAVHVFWLRLSHCERQVTTVSAAETGVGGDLHDVVVIGAGFAGLAAAAVLADAGCDVVVVEARDRVGGRSYSEVLPDGVVIDHGGQWVGPTQTRLLALAQRHGIATFPTHDTGNNLESNAGTLFTYVGPIPTSDPDATSDAIAAMLDLNLMALEVPLDSPWTAPSAREWDAITVQSWIDAEVDSPRARQALALAIQAVFSAEPSDLSLLHLLFYIHSAGGLTQLLGVTGCAQDARFVGGSQAVANAIAAELGSKVSLSSPVRSITQTPKGVRVTHDGGVVDARFAVVAVSPSLASRLSYDPPMPGLRDQLTQRMPLGTVIKLHAIYDRPFWRDAGLSGQATADEGAVRVIFDNSPSDGSVGILMGFIEGEEGRIWGARSEADRKQETLTAFARFFGDEAAAPNHFTEKVWADDEWARGGYAGLMPPGGWTSYGSALREPVGRIHWAGTETATEWNGYIDGAVRSGERAAAEVLQRLSGSLAEG